MGRVRQAAFRFWRILRESKWGLLICGTIGSAEMAEPILRDLINREILEDFDHFPNPPTPPSRFVISDPPPSPVPLCTAENLTPVFFEDLPSDFSDS